MLLPIFLAALAAVVFLAGIIVGVWPPSWLRNWLEKRAPSWVPTAVLLVGVLAATALGVLSFRTAESGSGTLSPPEYEQRVQRVACEITSPAREAQEKVLPMVADLVRDPTPEKIRVLLAVVRQVSDRAQIVVEKAVFDLSPVVPPEKYRNDHELFMGSLRTLESAMSEVQRLIPTDIEQKSDEELFMLLAEPAFLGSLVSGLSALVVAVENEDYSGDFEQISTCQATAIATSVAPTIASYTTPEPDH